MLEDNSRSNPNLDMTMPAGGGLPLRIAMSVPLKGSTAAYTRVARRTAGRFKGRNSCLALEKSLHARTHERLFKDARSSTGIPSISLTTSWVLKPTPVSQLRLWVYRTLNILPKKEDVRVSHSRACHWVCTSAKDTHHHSFIHVVEPT
jgi:hypothetical protein